MADGWIEVAIQDGAPYAFSRHLECLVVVGREFLRNFAVHGGIGHVPGSKIFLQTFLALSLQEQFDGGPDQATAVSCEFSNGLLRFLEELLGEVDDHLSRGHWS